MTKAKVSTITSLSRILDKASSHAYEESEGVVMPEDIAEIALSTINTDIFKKEDIFKEVALASAERVRKRICTAIKYEPQMVLPTIEAFSSAGISFDGGMIRYVHAQPEHLQHHIEMVLENQAKVNSSANRSVSLDSKLIKKIYDDADILNAGDAMQELLDEDLDATIAG